jgi:hypothetical protein
VHRADGRVHVIAKLRLEANAVVKPIVRAGAKVEEIGVPGAKQQRVAGRRKGIQFPIAQEMIVTVQGKNT